MFIFLPFPLSFKPCPAKTYFPSWAYELGLLGVLLFQESVYYFFEFVKNWSISSSSISLGAVSAMFFKWCCSVRVKIGHEEDVVTVPGMNIFALPELTLECVLSKLSPAELCNMAGVCKDFRERCTSDFLWKRLFREKWGRVIGEAACRKWELHITAMRDSDVRPKERVSRLACVWPLSFLDRMMEDGRKPRRTLRTDSIMSFYMALENDRFTFPAQIYNRQNGTAGFLMSCYDAEISYNSRKNTFYARYPSHGKRVPAIEEVPWERIRAPAVGTSAHDLHISSCLSDLNPGDHIEIQWRKNKEFPYGWWYGIVGHLEACFRGEDHCRCHASDIVVLEFNHYAPGSSWRKKVISRKEHREDGNANDGFYGGIRKIQSKEEISTWMQFWPTEALE